MTGKADMKKILMTMGMINAMLGSEFMDQAYEFLDEEIKDINKTDDKHEQNGGEYE